MEKVYAMNGEIKPGLKVLCQDGGGLCKGVVKRFTPSTVVINVLHPYIGRRQIQKETTKDKIYIV